MHDLDFGARTCYTVIMEYCISDIHGCYDLFCRLMDKIRFSDGDTLYVLGDMVDKGRDGIRLTKLLFSMPNAVCIAGNHEYDFLKFYRARMRQTEDYDGVLHELRAYFPDGGLLDWETVDKLDFLPYYIEKEDWIGVHAGLPVLADGTLLAPQEATCEQLVYDRRFKDPDVLPKGGKCVVFGHTITHNVSGGDEAIFYPRPQAQRAGRSIADYCKIHIDTGAWMRGVLSCLCVQTCEVFFVRRDF